MSYSPIQTQNIFYFKVFLLLFLPVCINVKWKIRTLLLSKARNKMCPNLILIKDQFRGIVFFFFKFSFFFFAHVFNFLCRLSFLFATDVFLEKFQKGFLVRLALYPI